MPWSGFFLNSFFCTHKLYATHIIGPHFCLFPFVFSCYCSFSLSLAGNSFLFHCHIFRVFHSIKFNSITCITLNATNKLIAFICKWNELAKWEFVFMHMLLLCCITMLLLRFVHCFFFIFACLCVWVCVIFTTRVMVLLRLSKFVNE